MRSYQHHIGDFNNATRHLDRLERSIYRDMIELYYDTEQPLPLDVAVICRRILARSNEEATAVQRTLNEFFNETPNGWYHDRCEQEIDKFSANNSQKAVAGKASAAKRALKRQQALNGNPTDVEIPLNGDSTGVENLNHKPQPNITASSESTDSNRCPVNKVIEAYKQNAPSLVQPRIITDATKAAIAARWRQDPRHQTAQFWKDFFAHCEASDFLAGRANGRNGSKPFRADLEWTVKAGNFAKIINGNYHGDTQ